jgi:hypothetical protein
MSTQAVEPVFTPQVSIQNIPLQLMIEKTKNYLNNAHSGLLSRISKIPQQVVTLQQQGEFPSAYLM